MGRQDQNGELTEGDASVGGSKKASVWLFGGSHPGDHEPSEASIS
jgi:hypothetical protein